MFDHAICAFWSRKMACGSASTLRNYILGKFRLWACGREPGRRWPSFSILLTELNQSSSTTQVCRIRGVSQREDRPSRFLMVALETHVN